MGGVCCRCFAVGLLFLPCEEYAETHISCRELVTGFSQVFHGHPKVFYPIKMPQGCKEETEIGVLTDGRNGGDQSSAALLISDSRFSCIILSSETMGHCGAEQI